MPQHDEHSSRGVGEHARPLVGNFFWKREGVCVCTAHRQGRAEDLLVSFGFGWN